MDATKTEVMTAKLAIAEKNYDVVSESYRKVWAELSAARAEVSRLSGELENLKLVNKDFGEQIIAARREREALELKIGKPMAYAVWTTDGEFDYRIFGNEQDAKDEAIHQAELADEGEPNTPETPPREIVPLYTAHDAQGELREVSPSYQA